MARRDCSLLVVLLLGVVLGFAAAQTGVKLPGSTETPKAVDNGLCLGAPAKVRYQWVYALKEPTAANLAALDKIIKEWMNMCTTKAGGSVIRYGQGPTMAKSPADYGYKGAPPATVTLADYGAWSDWTSVNDVKACYTVGVKAGVVQRARVYAKSAARVVFSLAGTKGGSKDAGCKSGTSAAPAKLRFMALYTLKDSSPKGVAKTTELWFKAASETKLSTGAGPDLVADKDFAAVYGPGAMRAGNYAGWRDFKSIPTMTAEFTDPAVSGFTNELRALPARSWRVVIDMP